MSGHTSDRGRQPSAEEWRMLRAIIWDEVSAARSQGPRAIMFRGFRLVARQATGLGHDRLDFVVFCDDGEMARLPSAVARNSGLRSPWPNAEPTVRFLACCRCDFLVGCVSPIDARNASPGSGQIS